MGPSVGQGFSNVKSKKWKEGKVCSVFIKENEREMQRGEICLFPYPSTLQCALQVLDLAALFVNSQPLWFQILQISGSSII